MLVLTHFRFVFLPGENGFIQAKEDVVLAELKQNHEAMAQARLQGSESHPSKNLETNRETAGCQDAEGD